MQSNLITLKTSDQRTEALAGKMFELFAECGEATETALLREGFSKFELQTLGPAAVQIAEKRRIRIEEGFTRTDDEWVEIAVGAAPDVIDERMIFERLRSAGIPTLVLGRIWDKVMIKLAASLARRPLPQVA